MIEVNPLQGAIELYLAKSYEDLKTGNYAASSIQRTPGISN